MFTMSDDTNTKRVAPLFPTGQFLATPAALHFLGSRLISVTTIFERHVAGDWGDLDAKDK
jgi:hypothetical protein